MEVGTLQFWVGSTRYRVLRRCVDAGQNLPLAVFSRIEDLAVIRRSVAVEPIAPLPVINLDTDEEEDGPPDEVVNVWHTGPVRVSSEVDFSNFNFLREIGEFHGDFAAYKMWLRRYR